MSEKVSKTGFYPADILLPKNVDMNKWAVVACDQFTSQPEYWEQTDRHVSSAPSTLRLILPEAKLGLPSVEFEIQKINNIMHEYLRKNIFEEHTQSLVYIERTQSDGKIRHGLIGMIDLEQYDFKPGNDALIRATEGTVLSRIPPRVKVREHAPLELPHIMLLIDDPDKMVIEPLTANSNSMKELYDFNLQQGGGQIKGWLLTDTQIKSTSDALLALTSEEQMQKKYNITGKAPLLFAVGDGNHSLATAKQCYENLKKITPEEKWVDLPARYALVEVVNNHDDALQFEPIHRVLFGVNPLDVLNEFKKTYPLGFEGKGNGHVISYSFDGRNGYLTVMNPEYQLEVATLQTFLDKYFETHKGEIDYIHGDETAKSLGNKPGNMAFLLPAMEKDQLFKTVIEDGVLPRKTFSMGHAQDKRYYIEARKIR